MEPITVTCGKDCQKDGHALRQVHPWILGVGVVSVNYCSRIPVYSIRLRVKDALGLYSSGQNGGCIGAICDEIKKDFRQYQK